MELFKDDSTVAKELIRTFLKGKKEAEELFNKGIDVNIKDSNWSVIELAIKQGNSEVVTFLLDHGAEITKEQALNVACGNDQEDLVMLLLRRFDSADGGHDNEDHQRALEFCLSHFADKPDKCKLIEEILNYAGSIADYGRYYSHPLLVACQGGNENVVRLLMDKGADLYCRDVDEKGNALHWAARSKNSNLISWLLTEGFAVNEENGSGNNALSVAMLHNNANVVDVLLKCGAKFKTPESELQISREVGNEAIAKLIIETGADIDEEWKIEKFTPLQIATEKGFESIVKLLLESGAKTSVLTYWDETLLHLAVENRNEKLVKLYLQRGLDVSAKTKYRKETPLELACRYDNEEIIKLLLHYATDIGEDLYLSALKGAIDSQQEKVIKLLFELETLYGMKLRDPKQLEDFMLLASKKGNRNIVEILFKRGIDVNCKDEYGHSALYHAFRSKDAKTISFLLNNGANIEEEILIASVKGGFKKFAENLLQKGLNINWRRNKNKFSALESSIDNFDLFKTLWNHGGNVNARGHRNVPLLNLACFTGNMDVVNFLLDKGADVMVADTNGINCLISAVDGGNLGVVKMLLEKGIDLEYRDSFGRTPLAAALINYYRKVYKYNANDLKCNCRFKNYTDTLKIVEFLLDYGATLNIDNQNDCENFLFTYENKFLSKLKLLFAYNLDVNFVNELWAGLNKSSNWNETGKIITQFVVKAQSKCVFVKNKILLDINENDSLRAHRIECEKEVQLMKEKIVGNSTIPFYNILVATDLNQLAEYSSNIDVHKVFSPCYKVSTECRAMFPLYFDEMRYQIKKGIWRKFLLNRTAATEADGTPSRKISASNRKLQSEDSVNDAKYGIYNLSVNYEC